MPVATVSQTPIREELKSVEDGYITIRPLPYGEKLDRQGMASRMSMEAEKGSSNRIDFELMQKQARMFEFKNCIVEHNLTDENDVPLDFSNPMTFKVLNPKIGEEIEKLLDKHNGEESEEELENLKVAAMRSSGNQNDSTKEPSLTK